MSSPTSERLIAKAKDNFRKIAAKVEAAGEKDKRDQSKTAVNKGVNHATTGSGPFRCLTLTLTLALILLPNHTSFCLFNLASALLQARVA